MALAHSCPSYPNKQEGHPTHTSHCSCPRANQGGRHRHSKPPHHWDSNTPHPDTSLTTNNLVMATPSFSLTNGNSDSSTQHRKLRLVTNGSFLISGHFARDFRHQKFLFFLGHNARLTMGKPGNGNVTNRVGNYNLHGRIIHLSTHQTWKSGLPTIAP